MTADWQPLELQGVGRDTKLNLSQSMFGRSDLKHVARHAVNLAGGGFAELTLVSRDNGLLLTTREMTDREVVTRLYEVGDPILATNRTAYRLNAWLAVPPARWRRIRRAG